MKQNQIMLFLLQTKLKEKKNNLSSPDYSKEFDDIVIKYNEWLSSIENPKVRKKRNLIAFLKGMGSAINLFGENNFQNSHPLYFRKDLSPKQKDAIALASDCMRVKKDLEKTAYLESCNIQEERKIILELYNYFKEIYLNEVK